MKSLLLDTAQKEFVDHVSALIHSAPQCVTYFSHPRSGKTIAVLALCLNLFEQADAPMSVLILSATQESTTFMYSCLTGSGMRIKRSGRKRETAEIKRYKHTAVAGMFDAEWTADCDVVLVDDAHLLTAEHRAKLLAYVKSETKLVVLMSRKQEVQSYESLAIGLEFASQQLREVQEQ